MKELRVFLIQLHVLSAFFFFKEGFTTSWWTYFFFNFDVWLLDHVAASVLSLRDTVKELTSSLSPRVNLYLQGQSRRVQVELRSVPDSGTMPLIAVSIVSVSIGDVKVRQMRPAKGSESQWVREEI